MTLQRQKLVTRVWQNSSIGKAFFLVIVLSVFGCSTVHYARLGEPAKSSYVYPLIFLQASKTCQSDELDSRTNSLCSKYALMAEEVLDKKYGTNIKLKLREGLSEKKIRALLGAPEIIKQTEDTYIYEYFQGHLQLLFENKKLLDVRLRDRVGEDFLPVQDIIARLPIFFSKSNIEKENLSDDEFEKQN